MSESKTVERLLKSPTKSKKEKPVVEQHSDPKEMVWLERDKGKMFYSKLRSTHETLPAGIWILEFNPFTGFYFTQLSKNFTFNHKVYGLEKSLIARISKSYEHITGNLGVLFNGVKGTGKTVTAKMICNDFIKRGIPVILVTEKIEGGIQYINNIAQDLVIFVDEYEKVYSKDEGGERGDAELLTVMDGAQKSDFRRTFLLTTNQLHINDNMIQRPGRIRYLKQFGDLSKSVVEEVVDDKLIHKSRRDALVRFIMSLEIVTIDIVNAVIQEVNIHNEDPEVFKGVFNVKTLEGKYDVHFAHCDSNGVRVSENDQLAKNAKIWPREFTQDFVGNSMQIDDYYVGKIVKVIDSNTAIVATTDVDLKDSVLRFHPEKRTSLLISEFKHENGLEIADEPSPIEESGKPSRRKSRKAVTSNSKAQLIEVTIQKSYIVNRRSWSDYGYDY